MHLVIYIMAAKVLIVRQFDTYHMRDMPTTRVTSEYRMLWYTEV